MLEYLHLFSYSFSICKIKRTGTKTSVGEAPHSPPRKDVQLFNTVNSGLRTFTHSLLSNGFKMNQN